MGWKPDVDQNLLLLLVTILAQALFTLVGCNLMSFTFFTARHILLLFVLYFVNRFV